jgi:glycolate oxidase iron-sulfur subunit
VVNVAGFGSSMKESAVLLRDDSAYAERAAAFCAKVRDISELLDELGPVAPRTRSRRASRSRRPATWPAPRAFGRSRGAVLRGIPRSTFSDIPETEICCGSRGTSNPVQPEPAERLGPRGRVDHQHDARRHRHVRRRMPAADRRYLDTGGCRSSIPCSSSTPRSRGVESVHGGDPRRAVPQS